MKSSYCQLVFSPQIAPLSSTSLLLFVLFFLCVPLLSFVSPVFTFLSCLLLCSLHRPHPTYISFPLRRSYCFILFPFRPLSPSLLSATPSIFPHHSLFPGHAKHSPLQCFRLSCTVSPQFFYISFPIVIKLVLKYCLPAIILVFFIHFAIYVLDRFSFSIMRDLHFFISL